MTSPLRTVGRTTLLAIWTMFVPALWPAAAIAGQQLTTRAPAPTNVGQTVLRAVRVTAPGLFDENNVYVTVRCWEATRSG